MSEVSERLRSLEADHAPDGWPAVQMRDITAVLDELDAMHEARESTECEPYASMVARIAKLTTRVETLRKRLLNMRAISHPQNEHNRAIEEILKETE